MSKKMKFSLARPGSGKNLLIEEVELMRGVEEIMLLVGQAFAKIFQLLDAVRLQHILLSCIEPQCTCAIVFTPARWEY